MGDVRHPGRDHLFYVAIDIGNAPLPGPVLRQSQVAVDDRGDLDLGHGSLQAARYEWLK